MLVLILTMILILALELSKVQPEVVAAQSGSYQVFLPIMIASPARLPFYVDLCPEEGWEHGYTDASVIWYTWGSNPIYQVSQDWFTVLSKYGVHIFINNSWQSYSLVHSGVASSLDQSAIVSILGREYDVSLVWIENNNIHWSGFNYIP